MAAGTLAGCTLVARYEVLDLVGVGGMGEVYRARDRELDDLIALKVIRGELLAQPEALARFRNEVKLARRVTHRNVARAYELVIADAATFYTMELVDGVSLAQYMRRARRLAIPDAIAIILAVCDALSAAHAAGIVHRDVKPENILVEDGGRVVLTDFGIAAALGQVRELAGTPRYMAPEQARGEEPSVAADTYSLGVVLYELLSGQPAFAVGDIAEVARQKTELDHLHLETGEPELDVTIARATSRDPEHRFQSAAAFRRALASFSREDIQARSSTTSMRRAAPLPTIVVRRASDAQAGGHLVEAMHQAIVDRLVEWPRLRVATRMPSDRIVEGCVDIAVQGDELELVALVRPHTLRLRLPLDADSLQRSAERAARVLAALLGSDVAPPPIHDRLLPPEALELIVRARYAVRRDRSRLPEAIGWCERALLLAPGHPRVEATLATCLAQLSFYASRPSPDLLDRANEHALAALARAPELADAHFARAHVELHRGYPISAAVCFRMAIARAPLSAEAHEWLGRMLLEAGFLVDANARLDDASSLGTLPASRWESAIALALEGRWPDVDALVDTLTRTGVDRGYGYRLRLGAWRGRPDREAYAGLRELSVAHVFEQALLTAVYDPDGPWLERRARIRAIVDGSRQPSQRHQAFVAQLAAEAAGQAGDRDECIAMLLRANACGLFDLHWLDRCPLLRAVAGEPRYAIIRTDVATRAEAIHDALFGDHRDEATVVTALA